MSLHLFIAVFVVLFMGTMAIHVGNNKILIPRSRVCFCVASGLVGFYGLLDALITFLQDRPGNVNLTFIFVCMVIELIFAPSAFAVLAFACDMRRLGIIATIIWAVCSLVILITAPMGLLFSLSPEGLYVAGPYAFLIYIFIAIQMSVPAVFTYILSKRYKKRDLITLHCLMILMAFGLIVPFLIDEDGVLVLGRAICLAVFYTYYSGLYFQDLQENIEAQKDEIALSSLHTVQALAGAVDAKDHYTRGHSWRVSEYAMILARELGWSDESITKLKYDALLHDVGKIGIPDSVLNKGRGLSEAEYGMIKLHTTLGSEIISSIDSNHGTFTAARSHHERYDGKGYPDHLTGEAIPENARLICIVDTYDAMNSDRIYRKAMPKEKIREEMLKGRGVQFDPAMLDAFITLFDQGRMDVMDNSARSDFSKIETDAITDLLGDYLKFFEVKKEYTGRWDDEVKKVRDVYNLLKRRASDNDRQYDLAVVTIVAKDGVEVSENKLQEAMDMMLKTADDIISESSVCAQISMSQLVFLINNEASEEGSSGGVDDSERIMKEILLYFYKINEVGDFDINYEIIKG